MLLEILHQPTFMKQYEEHWADPAETKVMWLGLIYSMLSLTKRSYHQLEDEPPEYEGFTAELSDLYRVRQVNISAPTSSSYSFQQT